MHLIMLYRPGFLLTEDEFIVIISRSYEGLKMPYHATISEVNILKGLKFHGENCCDISMFLPHSLRPFL